MKNLKFGISALLVAMLILSMAVVPAMGAESKETTEQWKEEQTKKWMDEHTINVTSTTTYRYEDGQLEITEIYTGNDIETKFGINNLTDVHKIPVDTKTVETISLDGETFNLNEGNEKVVVTEKTVVLTRQEDPYPWWTYGYNYPQYTWAKIFDYTFYYERVDPINLAWEGTSLNTVSSKILEQPGWVDDPVEQQQWVSDPAGIWLWDSGLASDKFGTNGRDHIRVWQLSSSANNAVVGSVHEDSPAPHEVINYESVETEIGWLFDSDNWQVSYDNYWLNNQMSTPATNDGKATIIS